MAAHPYELLGRGVAALRRRHLQQVRGCGDATYGQASGSGRAERSVPGALWQLLFGQLLLRRGSFPRVGHKYSVHTL